MIDKVLFYAGAIMFLMGIGGLGGACEGQGSYLISSVVFIIGFSCSLYEFVKGTEYEKK